MWFKLKKESKQLPPLREIKKEVVSPKPQEMSEESISPEPVKSEPEVKQVGELQENFQQPPLFIKLDKYKELVNAISQLSALTQMVKNSLLALEHLQKTQAETTAMVKKTLSKVEEKLRQISKEIIKTPAMPFMLSMPEYSDENLEEIQSLDATIASLKSQIEQLKQELSSFR